MKRTFSTELAYVFGIVFVAEGVVLMEKADFGVSMVVAPAYLLYRWLSPAWSFVSFGMAEYCMQAVLLLAMCLLLRRFRVSYLFSFVTAVVYGFVLDAFMLLGAMLPAGDSHSSLHSPHAILYIADSFVYRLLSVIYPFDFVSFAAVGIPDYKYWLDF